MQVPISEARTKLPHLIKQLQRNPNLTYEITIHREVVAELKAPLQLPAGGEAAKRLLSILDRHRNLARGRRFESQRTLKSIYMTNRMEQEHESADRSGSSLLL